MFYYDDLYSMKLSEYGVSIPLLDLRMVKILEFVKAHFDQKLIKPNEFHIQDLNLAHSHEFVQNLKTNPKEEILKTFELIDKNGEFNRYDPSTSKYELGELVKSIYPQVQGTVQACEHAIKTGFGFNIGGGMHHSMTDFGRGFCLINDMVIAARKLMNDKVGHVWIIDVDVHKGDGTAQIVQDDEAITCLSIHMAEGWPLNEGDPKRDPWFIPSDIDIPIYENEESLYLDKLEKGLNQLSKNFPKADLAIIVQGSDPYEHDGLPSSEPIKLTKKQMLERDTLVYEFLKNKNIPQAYVLGGGYGPNAYEPYVQFLESIKSDLDAI